MQRQTFLSIKSRATGLSTMDWAGTTNNNGEEILDKIERGSPA